MNKKLVSIMFLVAFLVPFVAQTQATAPVVAKKDETTCHHRPHHCKYHEGQHHEHHCKHHDGQHHGHHEHHHEDHEKVVA